LLLCLGLLLLALTNEHTNLLSGSILLSEAVIQLGLNSLTAIVGLFYLCDDRGSINSLLCQTGNGSLLIVSKLLKCEQMFSAFDFYV
jgi:hypothetical protein